MDLGNLQTTVDLDAKPDLPRVATWTDGLDGLLGTHHPSDEVFDEEPVTGVFEVRQCNLEPLIPHFAVRSHLVRQNANLKLKFSEPGSLFAQFEK